MKRKRTDLSSSGSSSGSDETPVKDDRLSGGVGMSEAASEGVLKQERRGGRGRGGGRGRRGGRGGGRGGRGNKKLTLKGRRPEVWTCLLAAVAVMESLTVL